MVATRRERMAASRVGPGLDGDVERAVVHRTDVGTDDGEGECVARR